MSNVFPDRLRIGGHEYDIDSAPLEPYLTALPTPPQRRISMFSQRGYVATWTVHEGMLFLAEMTSEALAGLLARPGGPVAATWFSGFIRGWRGDSRHTGYPPRKFWSDEIVLEIVAGNVSREWALDLRGVRDQTSEELRLSLPAFLLRSL
jgi:hypothetical protein